MYIHRTRPKYSDEELGRLYSQKYDHTCWDDHVFRVQKTIEFAVRNAGHHEIEEIVDLSCGDASIPLGIAEAGGLDRVILGDYTEGYDLYGPLEATLLELDEWTPPRLFVLTETLEHLDNPLKVLDEIAHRTDYLLLSTPLHNPGDIDPNVEHYWTYDREGVELFTRAAGFEVLAYDEFRFEVEENRILGYRYGVWWFD